MAVQLNMSIFFVVLRCHRLIWLIEEFHPPKIILLPCANQRFSQETISLKHTFRPTLLESAMPVHPKVPPTVSPKVSTKVSSAPSSTQVTKRKQISLDALLVKRACNTQETVDSEIKCPSTSKGISSVTSNTSPTSEKSNTKAQRTSTNSWPDDIYNYVNLDLVSSLPDLKKYEILCNHWKPGSDFSFPQQENIGRRFRFAWLSRFPWLAYSAVANGGFCVTCVLFGRKAGIMQASSNG